MSLSKRSGKIFSLIIIITFCFLNAIFFLLPFNHNNETVYADWTSNTSAITQGDGTENNPYVIDSAQKLAYMALQCNNGAGNFQTAYYVQTTNIDISADEWVPINSFSGVYDGQGYTINGLKNTTRNRFSFFDVLTQTSIIKNLGFTNVNINRVASNSYDIAVLTNDSYGTIQNCFATGTINIDTNSLYAFNTLKVGGLVKWVANGTISNCYVDLDVSAINYLIAVRDTHAGGICQQIDNGVIENCYSIGNIYVYGGYWKVGGITAYPNGGTIRNCAVLSGSCKQSNNTKNDFFNQDSGGENTVTENCSVVAESVLKNSSSAPLSSWEWNQTNAFPRTWGFVSDSNSEFYNNGYPQLRVFYENFTVNFYNEDGTQLFYSTNLRYPQYSVDFSGINVPSKTGYTYKGVFSTEINGGGIQYTSPINEITSNLNLYVYYEVNYYHLTITTSNDLAGNVTLRDEEVAYGTQIDAQVFSVNEGFRFIEWRNISDNSFVTSEQLYSFSMPDSDVGLLAFFMEEEYSLKVVINNLDYGSVEGEGDNYNVGEVVRLQAIPNAGYQVDKFYMEDGTILSQSSTCDFTMPRGNTIIYLDFTARTYSVNVFSYPTGNATFTGVGSYYVGDEVTITINSIESGYHFACWKIDDPLKDNGDFVEEVLTFIMPAKDVSIYCYLCSDDYSYVAFVDLNGKIIYDEEILVGGSVTPPSSGYEIDGYDFLGWFDSKSGGNEITNFEGITSPRLIAYGHYEKVFACNLDITVSYLQSSDFATDLSYGLFFAIRSPNNKLINCVVYSDNLLTVSLPEEGIYNFTYAVPTYYSVEIYYNGNLLNEKSFVVDLYSEKVTLNFVITNTNDYLLHDESTNFTSSSDGTINLDPVIDINGEKVYIGIENAIANSEFQSLESSEIPQSPYGYQLKDVLGAINWGGLYNFTELDYLLEGANILAKDMGSSVYKFSLANNYQSMYPFNSDWGNKSINTMKDLAQTDIIKNVLSMPEIKTYIMIAYEFVYCPWEKVITDYYTLQDLEIYYQYVRDEFADLTEYLLTEYANDEKIFILSNWEGDNAYGPIFDLCSTDEERQLLTDAYIGYINARQDGIIEGRARVGQSSSKVYGNFEVCHIGQNIPYVPERWRLVDVAVPYTYCDLYSLSDWYSYLQDEDGNYTFALENLLDELYSAAQSNLCYTNPSQYPLNPDFEGVKNIMVTEFGYDENTDSQYLDKIQHEIKTAVEWGVYKLVYWEIYSNINLAVDENSQPLHERPRNEDMQGLWLIRPDGTFSQSFWYMKSLIDGIDYYSSPVKIVFKMQYIDSEGMDWNTYKDQIIFKDDLTDASKMKDSSFDENRLSFTNIDSQNLELYFKNYTEYWGYVDTSGVIQNQSDDELSYITYDMVSNRFGIMIYNYTDIFSYVDLDYNSLELPIMIEGKTKQGTWEKIDNLKIEQTLDPDRVGTSSYWYQTYISGVCPIGQYTELRISFIPKGYNSWDPIISSVVFFEGGQA